MSKTVVDFDIANGLNLEQFPAYAPQGNEIAENFMQEPGFRAQVLLFVTQLGHELWAEAMSHGN